MRAFVTGNRGFIGHHITQRLLEQDYEVWGCDTRQPDNWLVPSGDCRKAFRGDCQAFNDMAWDQWDLVVHCAAMVEGREAIDGKPLKIGAYNTELDGGMFQWAAKAKPGRVVFFSSAAAYPVELQNPPYAGHRLCEADVDRGEPDQTYGWEKRWGERLAVELRRTGVPVTIVRPFSSYSSDQDLCYPFPAMVARAQRGDNPFDVWGDGQQVRDLIHVEDLVTAILACVDAGEDGPVNLGTGRGVTMDDLARACMAEAGYDAPIQHLGAKPTGVQHRVADTSLMNRYHTAGISMEEGVRRAMAGEDRSRCSTSRSS